MNLRGEYLYPTLGKQYLKAMRLKGRINSDATERTYLAALRLLQARYPDLRANEILRVERDKDGRFVSAPALDWLREGKAGWTENTQATYRKAVTGLVRWAAREGICEDWSGDLRDEFEVKVRTHRNAHWLEPEDVTLLLKACADAERFDVHQEKGDRDGMLIRVAVLSGLRCDELTSLTWSHIDFREGWVNVPKGKGNKERTVGLLEELEPALKGWRQRAAEDLGAIPTTHKVLPALKQGGGLWWDRVTPLTLAEQRHPAPAVRPFLGLSNGRVYEAVKFWGDKALGIDNLGPHDLRRTFAGLLETAGVPIQEIAKQLGHSSVDTTDRYLSSSPRRRVSALKGVRFGL